MKLKNHYVWLCVIWISSTLCDGLSSIVNFVEGNLIRGSIFLILSIAFAFVSGILLEKAITIYQHNKTCDWLHDFAEELREEALEKIKPFDEFENDGK